MSHTNRLSSLLARRRRSKRGMTLLEIMIVLAILALVMGLVVGPRVMRMFASSKVDIAKATAKKYAFEAYGQWAQAHPSKACPEKVEDLSEFMNSSDSKDPWGEPYKMFCGASAPAGVKGGVGIQSNGPDMKEGSEDDIKSWE